MTVRELENADIEKLRQLLRSSAWNDVMKLAIQGHMEVHRRLLELDLSERGDKPMNDETIRGVIRGLKWVLTRFEQEVQIWDRNQLVEERQAQMANGPPPGQVR